MKPEYTKNLTRMQFFKSADYYGMSKVYEDLYLKSIKNINVKKGDKVTDGQSIGYAGNTSDVECLSGVHVHLEAYKNNTAINPMSLLE